MSSVVPKLHRAAVIALMVVALVYAALAGLRTVADFDTGWQMASGRYIVQHHEIPSTDVFSYTAKGQEWVYPPLIELLLYWLHGLGGWPALSWLNAAACALAVGLMLAGGGVITAALATLAVPSIAFRTVPRADLATTVLFAATLALLWRHYRGLRSPLWLLPIVMLLWVNSHLGFLAGLALIVAYAGMEMLDMSESDRRAEAEARLRHASPWLIATGLATLVNPWGPGIYGAVLRQERTLNVLGHFLGEWSTARLTPAALEQALRWRDPGSGYWWLLAAGAAALVVSLWQARWGVALLLAGCGYLSLTAIRFQPLFATVAVVVAGSVLAGQLEERDSLPGMAPVVPSRALTGLALALVVVLLAGVGMRASDLVSNRYYVESGEISLFGGGLSWWYPERALQFIEREHLPGNLFHDYELGGYLTWRLPQYPDYIDGRALPFGLDFFFRQRALRGQPPDAPAWREESERRAINTLVFSVARYAGLGNVAVADFCKSQQWKPVYLDEVSVIFVRNTTQNAPLIQRLKIDCATAPLSPPAALESDKSAPGRARLFNFYANAGALLYFLARDAEAESMLEQAQKIFPDDPNLHLTHGQLLEADGHMPEAEQEYRTAVRLRPSDVGWYALGRLYSSERRYPEAAQAVEQSAQLSLRPSDRYLALGRLYLAMSQPRQALDALGAAAKAPRFDPPGEGASFQAQVAENRARAWRALGDLAQAAGFQEQALKLAPPTAQRWRELAEIYQEQGRSDLAQDAAKRAAGLEQPSTNNGGGRR